MIAMRDFRLLLLLPVLLAGCSINGGSNKPSAERFELEMAPAAKAAALPIGLINVEAPSWLQSPQMGYRLRYAKAARRDYYGLSRWVAPPAELVTQALRRGVPQGSESAGGCRLRVELEEFVQEFTSAADSVARIDARVRLLPARGEMGALGKRFTVVQPATFADAAGGAEALNRATAKWVEELRAWLVVVAETPAGRALCKG